MGDDNVSSDTSPWWPTLTAWFCESLMRSSPLALTASATGWLKFKSDEPAIQILLTEQRWCEKKPKKGTVTDVVSRKTLIRRMDVENQTRQTTAGCKRRTFLITQRQQRCAPSNAIASERWHKNRSYTKCVSRFLWNCKNQGSHSNCSAEVFHSSSNLDDQIVYECCLSRRKRTRCDQRCLWRSNDRMSRSRRCRNCSGMFLARSS